MLWHSGVDFTNFFTILGIRSCNKDNVISWSGGCTKAAKAGGTLIKDFSSLDASNGSWAAMIALTTAMPSRVLVGAADWYRTRWTLDALMPPMQTVLILPYPDDDRASSIERIPACPTMDFVFSFL